MGVWRMMRWNVCKRGTGNLLAVCILLHHLWHRTASQHRSQLYRQCEAMHLCSIIVACFRFQLSTCIYAEILRSSCSAGSQRSETLTCGNWKSVAQVVCKLWEHAPSKLWTESGHSHRRHFQRQGSGCPGQHRRPEQRAGPRFSAQHSTWFNPTVHSSS